jgi:YebC/PmpR family DNA-binding regulatory protein
MSGHSKWHNIKNRKGAQDKIRGKLFTKHAKLIAIAAKNGADPDMNPMLKQAIFVAKEDNVPNDNIARAIKKASGEGKDAVQYQELVYEAYAPGGVAVLVEVLTDNSNRAFSFLRTIVEKNGGTMGAAGSVSWMFKDKGSMELLLAGKSKEQIEMDVIESGAEDLEFGEDRVFVTTAFADLGAVRDFFKAKSYILENVKKDKVPNTQVEITSLEAANKFFDFIGKIEEEDDVTEVFHNAEISEEILKEMEE